MANRLPPSFQEQVVLSGLNLPTAVRFASDGRVFVAEKGGYVQVFDDLGDPTPSLFADLSRKVHTNGDRGLLGMTLDPGFPAEPYVYVLYTRKAKIGTDVPTNCAEEPDPGCTVSAQLSRLPMAGGAWNGTEDRLVQEWCQQFVSHSIGTVEFGPDGMLYAGGGEGAWWSVADYGQAGGLKNSCGDPPVPVGTEPTPPTAEGGSLRAQDLRTIGDPLGLGGSIIRVDPATGEGAPGNPLYDPADPHANAGRMIAHGLRNPFRFTFHPETGEIWIGDVGWQLWEEINRMSSGLSEVLNFGWPCYEGPNKQPVWDSLDLAMCEDLYSAEAASPRTVQEPFFAYLGNQELVPGDNCEDSGQTLSGMAFYKGGGYPARYEGAMFFADYSRGCIWAMHPGAGGVPNPNDISVLLEPTDSDQPTASPVDLQIGPGGDLFYVDIGTGTVRRIAYFGDNQPPSASAAADPTHGPVPLEVHFDGTGSTDPDGDSLTYQWDLDGDGQFDDATGAHVTHTYQEPGSFDVRLEVTEDKADPLSDVSEPIRISPGNEPNDPPQVVIDTPAGGSFAVGETVSFSGHATDDQDGALPDSALSWRLDLHHCPATCHLHPGQEAWSGTAGESFPMPDHEFPSHLELTLRATDTQGESASTSVRIDYKTTTLSFDTVPSGLDLSVNGDEDVTPFQRQVAVGATTSLTAPAIQQVGAETVGFQSWSDGGDRTHGFAAPASPASYVATYGGLIEVDTTTDEFGSGTAGACSLREAVRTSNTDADFGGCDGRTGPDTIALLEGSFTLTRAGSGALGDLDLSRSVTIAGAGAEGTFIEGNGGVTLDRVFQVASPAEVSIADLTVRGGQTTAGGGGLHVAAGSELHLDRVRVADNQASKGGGIQVAGGTLSLAGGAVTGNQATGDGGGILSTGSTATVTMEGGAVSRNDAGDEGGGLFASGGTLALDAVRVDENEAVGDDGGGIFRANGGTSILHGTFRSNVAADLGGGIYVGGTGATLEVRGSTFEANAAANGGALGSAGGSSLLRNTTLSGNSTTANGAGIRVSSGSVVLSNATVMSNEAGGDGGGLSNAKVGTITLRNSIVAGNADSTPAQRPDCAGAIGSGGHNLIGTTQGCSFAGAPGDLTGSSGSAIDPLLAPLADNGGPTWTHALLAGSPAKDAGNAAAPGSGGGACEDRDQRGVARVDCDIGAYEA